MFDTFHRVVSKRSRSLVGNKIRGVVVNINDPQNRGRVQVRARDVHNEVPDDQLVWAMPNEGWGHGTSGSGKKDGPRVGATVFLSHQDDSPYHPQWEHGPSTDDKQISELDQNTPGHVDAAGNLYSKAYGSDGSTNIITDNHQSGTSKVIDTDGTVTRNNVKNVTEKTFGDTHMIQGKKELVLDFDTITFKCNTFTAPMPNPGPPHTDPGNAPAARTKPTFTPPSGDTY